MAECQSGGVQGLTGSGSGDSVGSTPVRTGDPPAAAAAVDRVAHDRMADVLQMKSDLMSPAGMQLEPQELDGVEPRHDPGIGSSGTPSR